MRPTFVATSSVKPAFRCHAIVRMARQEITDSNLAILSSLRTQTAQIERALPRRQRFMLAIKSVYYVVLLLSLRPSQPQVNLAVITDNIKLNGTMTNSPIKASP